MCSKNPTKGEIEILQPNVVFSNQYVTVYNDTVRFPAGNEGTYIRINCASNSSVAVLPVTKEGKLVVLRIYRHGMRGWGVEIPKGAVEGNESHAEAAARELAEETGYTCRRLIHVCEYSESPAIFGSKLDCFIAEDCELAGNTNREPTEAIENAFEITVDDFLKRKYRSDFVDSISELLVYKYLSMKEALCNE